MPPPARAGGRATGVAAAIVVATAAGEAEGPAAALAWEGTTVLRRLLEQLAGLGIAELHVLTRPAHAAELTPALHGLPATLHESAGPGEDLRRVAALAAEARGAVVVLQGDLVTQREVLAGLLADPRVATGVLASGGRSGRPYAFKLRARRGRVLSAASPYHTVHRPNAAFLGVLKVADADRERLVAVAERLSAPAGDPPPQWREELATKAGTWKLAWARIVQQHAAREAAGLHAEPSDAEADAEDREAATRMELDLAGDDGAQDDPEDRLHPDDVQLGPDDAAELDRRVRAAPDDVAALLLVGLVRDDVHVGVSHLRRLFWSRPLSQLGIERARQRIADFDEDAALRASAVKASDGFFTTYLVSPYSQFIARWCARRGLTPNQVTVFSLFVGLLAAAAFATGGRWGLIAGAVLLQAAFTLDCVDGQLARYTRQFSKLGAWLDSVFDRSKEYLVFAGLAIGSAAAGDDVWVLACAALTLQTARHAIDFSYPASRHQAIATLSHPPVEQPWDGNGTGVPLWKRLASEPEAATRAPGPAEPPASPLLQAKRAWRRAGRNRRVRWAKKILMFPIGERFAAISLTAAIFDARVTFIVLLAWGGVAAAYIVAGRSVILLRAKLHAADAPAPAPDSQGAVRLRAYRDDGLLGRALTRLTGDGDRSPLRWLVPPLLRVLELGGITALAAVAGADAVPAAFALLCAAAFHHYDVVYRLRQRNEVAPGWLTTAGLGWDGRLVLVALLVVAGLAPAGLWVMAALLAILYVSEAVRGWAAFGRTQTGDTVYADEEEDEE